MLLKQDIKEYVVIPCSCSGTICVGASDPDATLAPYSNYPSSAEQKRIDPASKDPTHGTRLVLTGAKSLQIFSDL